MKRLAQSFLTVIASFAFVGIANAEHMPGHNMHPDHPCAPVFQACKTAGFEMGAHKEGKGKGMMVDCVGKLAKGEAVEGVTVTPSEECKAKMAEMKEHRKEHRKGRKKGA